MSHAQQIHSLEIAKAAELVGIGSVTLFRELRRRNVLDEKNIPVRYYAENHYFRSSFRRHLLRGTLIKRYYTVTEVLPLGMALISEIAREIRHGRTPATPVRASNQPTPNAIGEAERTKRRAELLAFLSGNTPHDHLPAPQAAAQHRQQGAQQ